MMKLREALKELETASGERRVKLASGIADVLRFRGGMNYDQTVEFICEHVLGMTPEYWETLMYEADTEGV